MPFENGIFDQVLSFHVLEDVQKFQKTLDECCRVLKPNGKLFLVFPSYCHPIQHHFSLVTKTPFFHYFIGSKTLIKAYHEILQEPGKDAYCYKRDSSYPESWERYNAMNGTTLNEFKQLIKKGKWQIILQSKIPIGSVGRKITKKIWALFISHIIHRLIFVPVYVLEIFE